jgi:hypothetical protein
MRDETWFSGVMGYFSGDGVVGQTVVVNDKVLEELRDGKRGKKEYVVVNGYKVFGSRNVGRDEIFFPGCER